MGQSYLSTALLDFTNFIFTSHKTRLTVGRIQRIQCAMSTLHSEITAFCEAHSIAKTQFGLLALNDKAFVGQLEKGRRTWPETEAKVRRFMATYRPQVAA